MSTTYNASPWHFSPSLGAAIGFLTLFSITTLGHIIQAIYHRKLYCFIVIMACILQVLAYDFRVMSIQQKDSDSLYTTWFALILVAPILTNMFVYTVFGHMINDFAIGKQIWYIRSKYFGFTFIVLDVIAFVVQLYGAVQASGADNSNDEILDALHIYMSGVGLQLLVILVFLLFASKFYVDSRRLQRTQAALPREAGKGLFQLFHAIFIALILIIVSNGALHVLQQ